MGKARVDLNWVTTVGLDLTKHVFQIHAVGAADGSVVIAAALPPPNEFVCKLWTIEPQQFTFNPLQQMPGLNI